MGERVDWYDLTARRVHGKPADWLSCIWSVDAPEGYLQIIGAVPVGFIAKGPRKGRPKWPKRSLLETVWMKRSDVEETRRIWEQKTGKCCECQGEGQTVRSFGVSGTTYRTCVKCNGRGTAGGDCEYE